MNVVNMERGGETASPFVIRNSVIKLACFERTPFRYHRLRLSPSIRTIAIAKPEARFDARLWSAVKAIPCRRVGHRSRKLTPELTEA